MGVSKKIIFFLILFIVMVISVFYFFTIPYGENIIRGAIENKISKSLGLQVRIGSFETNLFSHIQLSDITIPQIFDTVKSPLMTVDYARVEFRLWHLISLKPYIDQVIIDSLSVNVARDSSGYRLPVFAGKKKKNKTRKPLNFGLKLGRLDLNNSSVAYDDYTLPLLISAGNVNVNVEEQKNLTYKFRLVADAWKTMYRAKSVSINSLYASGILSHDQITIEKLELAFPDLLFSLRSTLDMGKSPLQINGNAKIQGDIIPIIGMFGELIPQRFYPLKGSFDTNIGFEGTINDPNVTFSMGLKNIELIDTSLDNLCLEGDYRKQAINLQKIYLELLDGTMSGKGTVALDSLLYHDFSLEVSGISFEKIWELIYRETSPYSGYLNGFLETKGPLKIPKKLIATARLSFDNATYQSKKLESIKTKISYKDNVFSLDLKQNTTELSTGIKLLGEEIKGNFQFVTTNPGVLAGFAKIFDMRGSLYIEGAVSGKLENPSITANINFKDIRLHGFPIDYLNGGVIYENKRIFLKECKFSGSLASADSLTFPFHIPGLHSGLNYTGSLDGPVNNPVGQIDINLSRPTYNNIQFDSINTKITVADRNVVIEHSRIVKDSLEINIGGALTIPSIRGNANLVFTKRAIDNPKNDVKQTEEVEKKGISDADEPFLGNMTFEFAFADSGNILLNARGKDMNVGQIGKIYSDSLNIDGILDFQLDFNGTPQNPFGSLQFVLNKPAFNGMTFDSVRSNLRIDSEKLVFEMLEVYINKQKTWAKAEIGLKRSSKGYPSITGQSYINCSAEGKNITVQLLKLIMPPEMNFSGSSTYKLDCRGIIRKPSIRGNFNIIDSELYVKHDSPPIQNINIHAVLQDSVITIDPAEGTISNLPVLVKGFVATSDWEKFRTEMTVLSSDQKVLEGAGTVSSDMLEYQVDISDFDVALLQTIVPDLKKLSGRMNAMMRISGHLKDPELAGYVKVSEVIFIPPLLDLPLTQGYAELHFDSNTVNLDSLSINMDKGKILAFGNAAHSKGSLTQLEINSKVQNIKINRPKDFSLVIDSSDLNFTKQDNYYDLKGEIILGESRFVKNFQPRNLLPYLQKIKRPPKEPIPIFQQIRMNVLIRSSQKLWIDNNFARMRVRSEIGLFGTFDRPNITGRLSVEEGYIIYLDKKFMIVRGIVDSFDPNLFNPVFDFQAETNLKNYQTVSRKPYNITLVFGGTLEKVSLELTSDPPQDKSDIIALLTVGATRDQLAGKSSDGSDVTLSEILKERAEALSSQKISGYFSQKVGNLLNLEDVSIEGNLFNAGKSSGPQLIASEKISDRMEITYTTAVGHLNEQRIRLDYRLNKYFSVESETDQRGRSGVDLKYRLRFK